MIDSLRLIRSRYDALEVPKPCGQMHENVLDSMDYSIDGFTTKLAGGDDDEVTALFTLANRKMGSVLEGLEELRESMAIDPQERTYCIFPSGEMTRAQPVTAQVR